MTYEEHCSVRELKKEKRQLKNKLKSIHTLIHSGYILGLSQGKTITSKIFQEIDDIIDEPIIKFEEIMNKEEI